MAIGPRLDLRQSQQLVMTPQLRQAIKLLQSSNLEVSAFVEEELERNPLLDRMPGAVLIPCRLRLNLPMPPARLLQMRCRRKTQRRSMPNGTMFTIMASRRSAAAGAVILRTIFPALTPWKRRNGPCVIIWRNRSG